MNKKLIMLISLVSMVSLSIEKPNLDKYERQKRIGAKLGDFNNLYTKFDVNYINKQGFLVTNTINFGPTYYELKYDSKSLFNTIGISKNLRDFIIKKHDQSLNEFYTNKEKVYSEYSNILDIYANLIVKKYEIKLKYDLVNKLNSDKKILEMQYKVGKISKLEYETLLVELLSTQNKIDNIASEIKELLEELNTYGYSEDIDSISEFEIKELDETKLKKYVDSENEKNEVRKRIEEKNKLHSCFPDINIDARYTFEEKNFTIGLSINKAFKLDGSNFTEQNLGYSKTVRKISVQNEKERYILLFNTYRTMEKRAFLASEQYKVDKVKYEVGNISYKDLTDSKIKEDNAKIDLVKSKNELALYLLKKGI